MCLDQERGESGHNHDACSESHGRNLCEHRVSGVCKTAHAPLALGKEVPRRLSHAMIFFTAGEVVGRVAPEHVTSADTFDIWRTGNGVLRPFRPALEEIWSGRQVFPPSGTLLFAINSH
jgi:hypothetical protein